VGEVWGIWQIEGRGGGGAREGWQGGRGCLLMLGMPATLPHPALVSDTKPDPATPQSPSHASLNPKPCNPKP
jgi:hypothetical protein